MVCFNTTSPYLMTHYLGQGEKIVNDYPDTVRLGDVYEGYIPANPENIEKYGVDR